MHKRNYNNIFFISFFLMKIFEILNYIILAEVVIKFRKIPVFPKFIIKKKKNSFKKNKIKIIIIKFYKSKKTKKQLKK